MSDEEDNQLLIELQALENVIACKRKVTNGETDANVVIENGNLLSKESFDNAAQRIAANEGESSGEDDDERDGMEVVEDSSISNSYDDYSCQNLQELLELNKELLETINTSRDKMQSLLKECLKRKQIVNEQIAKHSSSWQAKIINFNAGMPYFKDKNHYTSRRNEDTETKIRNGELRLAQLQRIRRWNQHDKSNLLKTIRHEITLTLSTRVEPDENYISSTIKKTSQLPRDVKKAIGQMPNLDWMKISANIPENKHSAEECEVMWKVFLHPDINKQKWTSREDKMLNTLVEKHDFEDWDAIAKDLKTCRSGYQCFIRYNTNNWKNLMKGQSWTVVDDRYLCFLVSKLKIGDYTPWGYIASFMDSRTKQQVYYRYSYSLAPHLKKGRFSEEEDQQLLQAVEKYGPNFSKIAALAINNRTPVQLKEHHQTLERTNNERKVWTYAEDVLLMKLRKEHGPKWATIVQELPNTTRVQARQRYDMLARCEKRGVLLESIHQDNEERKPDHTTLTFTTNTPWSRESKEIHVNHLKIDDQLVSYFKRESLAKKEQSTKTYPPEQLAIDTRKLYDTLVKLNVNVNVPEYIDSQGSELSENFLVLLASLKNYADNRRITHDENVERVRLLMFGPRDPLADDQRFVPPPPFNYCPPRYLMLKKSGRAMKGESSIDAAPNVDDHQQIEVLEELQTEREVKNYLEEGVDIQFEKFKKLMVAPTTITPVPRTGMLRCKPFAKSNPFCRRVVDVENDNFIPPMRYDWSLGKMVPTHTFASTPMPTDRIPLSTFEPCRATLETYQEIIHHSSNFPTEFENPDARTYRLSTRGCDALNTFKRRYQQLFHMPTGLSRIVPPDTVDESVFLPALEKLKKTNPKKKSRKN